MMLGLSGPSEVTAQDWLDYGGTISAGDGGGGGSSFWDSAGATRWLNTLTQGTLAIVGSQTQKPSFETHSTPSGSSTIVRSGGGFNYPGGQGPTSVPTGGVSTTTMLVLGAAAMMMMVVMSKR